MRWRREGRPEPDAGPAVEGSLLDRLTGATLISVTFVHDFLSLTFELAAESGQLVDGPRLDCLVWPVVVNADTEVRFDSPGYRDALCACIGGALTGVRDDLASGMQLHFRDRSLVIRPALDDLSGREIALLRFSDTGAWEVWRPGEGAFADLR